MNPSAPAPAGERAPSERGEDGYSLVETLVAMSVFAVLLVVMMAAVLGISRGALRTQGTSDSTAQTTAAFSRMDQQVRYADAVNLPATTAAGDSYVEFRQSAVTTGTAAVCTQWRYRSTTGQLQVRQWSEGSTPSATGWSTLLTSSARTVLAPFTVVPAAALRTEQTLRVNLANTRVSAGTSALTTTFVARNSTATSPGNVDTAPADGISDAPVCAGLVNRP